MSSGFDELFSKFQGFTVQVDQDKLSLITTTCKMTFMSDSLQWKVVAKHLKTEQERAVSVAGRLIITCLVVYNF